MGKLRIPEGLDLNNLLTPEQKDYWTMLGLGLTFSPEKNEYAGCGDVSTVCEVTSPQLQLG